jgi:hypothetical protein
MIKATLVVTKAYQNNRIFDMSNPVNGRDNHLYTIKLLKDELRQYNIDLSTQDVNCINESEIIIYNDIPINFPQKSLKQRYYLLAMESIAVTPRNFNIKYYSYFDKIFTFYDDIIDNKKIFKINYSFDLNPYQYIDFNKKSGFICMVSGNKYSSFDGELYSERIKIINYFEHHLNYQFSLYGTNWDNAYKNSFYNLVKLLHSKRLLFFIFRILDFLINIFLLKTFFKVKYFNYKGQLSPKIPTLSKYKFNICYENTDNINGYITEKIFDCFISGCIPVYLGAPNILDYIPSNIFIDRRNFKNNDELVRYLNDISPITYLEFQKNILSFLKSDKSIQFSSKYTSNSITKQILNLL